MRSQRCNMSASVSIALRTVRGQVASSVTAAVRAYNSHALRSLALEATIVICTLVASDPLLRTRPTVGSRGALKRPGFGFRSSRPQPSVAGFRPA
nr:putative integron gene cassette protein [uncultured bacterium]